MGGTRITLQLRLEAPPPPRQHGLMPVSSSRAMRGQYESYKCARTAVMLDRSLHSSLCCRRNRSFTTEVEESTPHPIWSKKHVFSNVEHDEFLSSQVEVSVWNFSHSVKHECLGESHRMDKAIMIRSHFIMTHMSCRAILFFF